MPNRKRQSTARPFTVIDTHYIRPKLAASHLLVEGDQALFIDTGTALGIPHLLETLASAGLSPHAVKFIILTHIHLDHAGGAGALMQHCPRATLIVHPNGLRHMVNPEKLLSASIAIYGEQLFHERYGTVTAVAEERIIAGDDGMVVDFNGRSLRLLDTPGHARHHLSVWDAEKKIVFSGDTLGLAYPELQIEGRPPFLIPTTSPAAFDPEALERSIRAIWTLGPETFCLTHFGPVVADAGAVEILIELVRGHAKLGALSEDTEQLESAVAGLLFDAYRDYCRLGGADAPAEDRFRQLLAGDIGLNAQGIAAWQEQLRRR